VAEVFDAACLLLGVSGRKPQRLVCAVFQNHLPQAHPARTVGIRRFFTKRAPALERPKIEEQQNKGSVTTMGLLMSPRANRRRERA